MSASGNNYIDRVIQLIDRLSIHEKGYLFKNTSHREGGGRFNYIRLYNFITSFPRREKPDDEALKDFGNGKKPYDDAENLFNFILERMRLYHEQNNERTRAYAFYEEARFLLGRDMIEECKDRLKKALKLAERVEDDQLIISILKEKRVLSYAERNAHFLQELQQLNAQLDDHRNKLNTELELTYRYDQLFSLVQAQRSNAGRDQTEAPDDVEWTDIDKETFSHPATQLQFLRTRTLHWSLQQDEKRLLADYEEINRIWQKSPVLRRDLRYSYLVDLSNLGSLYHATNQQAQLKAILALLEKENQKRDDNSPREEMLLFRRIVLFKTLLLTTQAKPRRDIQRVEKQYLEGLQRYRMPPATQINVATNFAFLYFQNEAWKESLHWAREVLIVKRADLRQRDIRKVQLIRWIAFLELDEPGTSPRNERRSIFRFFQNKNITIPESEEELFQQVETYYKLPLNERKAHLAHLHQQLLALADSGIGQKYILNTLHYWIKARYHGCRLPEVAQYYHQHPDRMYTYDLGM